VSLFLFHRESAYAKKTRRFGDLPLRPRVKREGCRFGWIQ